MWFKISTKQYINIFYRECLISLSIKYTCICWTAGIPVPYLNQRGLWHWWLQTCMMAREISILQLWNVTVLPPLFWSFYYDLMTFILTCLPLRLNFSGSGRQDCSGWTATGSALHQLQGSGPTMHLPSLVRWRTDAVRRIHRQPDTCLAGVHGGPLSCCRSKWL